MKINNKELFIWKPIKKEALNLMNNKKEERTQSQKQHS